MFGVPVLVLLGFPLLVGLHLGRIWVGTFFLLMVDTFAAAVSPFREAFKRKNRKYIGLLPILGGGVPPDQYISGFFLRKKHL